MFACFRFREKLGALRVSRAYEFYLAVKEHCVLKKPKTRSSQDKDSVFAATSYQTYYAASSPSDAIDKECAIVLDRENDMWNCTAVNGSKSNYEFFGLPEIEESHSYNTQLNMRFLPCPCQFCLQGDSAQCTNSTIVGTVAPSQIYYKAPTVAPDVLDIDKLESYSNDVLLAFIKSKNLKGRRSRKADMIALIRSYYARLL